MINIQKNSKLLLLILAVFATSLFFLRDSSKPARESFLTYEADDLGIRFNYPAYVTVSRVGNKMSLDYDGHSLEVFDMLPNESTESAVNRLILIHPENDKHCRLETRQDEIIIRQLNYEGVTLDVIDKRPDYCNAKYTINRSQAYFINKGDKLLFLNLGQVHGNMVNDQPWEETIEVYEASAL